MSYSYDRTASFFTEKSDEEGAYYVKDSPAGEYIYKPDVSGGEVLIDSVDWGIQNLAEGLDLHSAEAFVKKDIQKREKLQAEERQEEKKVRTIAEQLKDLADDIRRQDSAETLKHRYQTYLIQAQQMGLINDKLRRQINKVNKGFGGLSNAPGLKEDMAAMLELIAKEALNQKLAALKKEKFDIREVTSPRPGSWLVEIDGGTSVLTVRVYDNAGRGLGIIPTSGWDMRKYDRPTEKEETKIRAAVEKFEKGRTKLAALKVAARHQRMLLADQPPGERKRDQDLTKPINKPRGIEKSIVDEHGRGVEHRDDMVDPDKRDIRPEDVFHGTPSQMNVRNLAETGKDLDDKTKRQIEKDKGYDTVKNLSQYLIRTEGGGDTDPAGKKHG